MSLLNQIEEQRRLQYLGDTEIFQALIDEGEAVIVKACKNIDPARPTITSQELCGQSSAFHKAYILHGTHQRRKLFIKHLADSGLEVYAYMQNDIMHFELKRPPVPSIYKDGLEGLEVKNSVE